MTLTNDNGGACEHAFASTTAGQQHDFPACALADMACTWPGLLRCGHMSKAWARCRCQMWPCDALEIGCCCRCRVPLPDAWPCALCLLLPLLGAAARCVAVCVLELERCCRLPLPHVWPRALELQNAAGVCCHQSSLAYLFFFSLRWWLAAVLGLAFCLACVWER